MGHGPGLEGGARHARGVGYSEGGMTTPEGTLTQLSRRGSCPGTCDTRVFLASGVSIL